MTEAEPFVCPYGKALPTPPWIKRIRIGIASAVGVCVLLLAMGAPIEPLLFLVIVGAIGGLIWTQNRIPKPTLFAGPRYVLADREIAYYQMADEFWQADGRFGLSRQGRELLAIRIEQFHVQTSKPDKARVKRQAKFERAREEVRQRALANQPALRVRS